MNKYIKIIICVAVCLAVGYFSGEATQSSVNTWFPTLVKPAFNPPSWVFFPVWTALYIMMGIAAGLVWDRYKTDPYEVRYAMSFFLVQLCMNALWSILFFGMQNPFLAMIEIVLLWLLIYETYTKFALIHKTAGYLFIPYLLWVSFAAALNASIWYLNR